MSVEKRIAGAQLQPTFLMANVEVVATYELYNINRSKLENLIHRIFEPARLEIEIMDRFGRPVVPREWFLVPLFVINDAVEKIRDGTITAITMIPALPDSNGFRGRCRNRCCVTLYGTSTSGMHGSEKDCA